MKYLAVFSLSIALAGTPPYLDPKQPIDVRVEDLLGRMTLEEKIGQINMPCVYVRGIGGATHWPDAFPPEGIKAKMESCRQFTAGTHPQGVGPGGGFFTLANTILYEGAKQQANFFNELQKIAMEKTRLKIPLLQTEEGTHGLMASGGTIFPEGPALGSTWNLDLIRDVYSATAREARAVGIHQLFTLVVEPNRDPRLGRNEEGYSEDPWLCSRFAEAIVDAVQGPDIARENKTVAGLCHYPGQSQPVGGLERGAMDVSERMLREVFLPPWVAGIKKKGALGVMATYPAIDGVPAHTSYPVLTKILREELGFRGLVMSEGGGITSVIDEHVGANAKHAGELALKAGLDVGISFEPGYLGGMVESVKEGRVSMSVLDTAVRRILRLKFQLGLFERPYVDPERAAKISHTPEHQRIALQAAREGIVLLKNDKNVLPLRKNMKTIAVIGPNADHARNQLGDYTSRVVLQKVVTVLGGIKDKLPQAKVLYAKGSSVLNKDKSGFDEAVRAAKQAEVAVVVLGENEWQHPEGGTVGEARDVASLDLTGVQQELLEAVHATGTPVVLVLINGRPLSIRWAAENVPAIVEAWIPGESGGIAVADVLFGDYNPSGRLPVTVPRHAGQLPMYYNSRTTRAKPGKNGLEWRKYADMPGSPLYPFGFGLSYTRFDYSNLKLSAAEIGQGGEVRVTADVVNSGERAGEEVVQLYVQDVVSSVSRPVREIRGFRKIALKSGERKTVEFTLGPDDLTMLDRNLQPVVEPGEFRVLVGASSEDIRLNGSFIVRQ